MDDNRRNFTENEKMILFNQVDGKCPICGNVLVSKKNGNIIKIFDIAHIYPANPRTKEVELLKNEERLSEDVNSLDNVIAVCKKCHKKFDTYKTIKEYKLWVDIKKKLIQDNQIKNIYSSFTIEIEIEEILKNLNSDLLSEEDLPQLSYESLKIDEKINSTLPSLIKRDIKRDVVDYFDYIKNIFIEMNKINPYKFETISAQIKGFYFKTMQINSNQKFVYDSLVGWLNEKTGKYSERACKVIVAYFIQNCEVFS